MTDRDVRDLGRRLQQACLEAALASYADAAASGLCGEGAFDVAAGAIRSLDVDAVATEWLASPAAAGSAEAGLASLTNDVANRFGSPGPPAAGSAAAATGAIAAALLGWVAARSAQRGPENFRRRADAIQRRAAVLQSSLASAAEEDARVVRALLQTQAGDLTDDTRLTAGDSLLEIGTRCAQTAALAAEVAERGHVAARSDAAAAARLAGSAGECALTLREGGPRPPGRSAPL